MFKKRTRNPNLREKSSLSGPAVGEASGSGTRKVGGEGDDEDIVVDGKEGGGEGVEDVEEQAT